MAFETAGAGRDGEMVNPDLVLRGKSGPEAKQERNERETAVQRLRQYCEMATRRSRRQ